MTFDTIKRTDVLTSARLAGMVRRYHTWPVFQVQTVADHSYQCMRVWFQMFGPLDARVSTYFLWHDAGEIVTGDLPYPVKKNNPELKEALDKLERAAVNAMGGQGVEVFLTPDQKRRAKVVDLTEMCEFGLHELALGNQFAEPIVEDTAANIVTLWRSMGPWECNQVVRYVQNMPGRHYLIQTALNEVIQAALC